MSVKFEDNHIRIKADMKSEAVAFLHEAAGALVSQTQRNTAVGKVSGGKTKSEWTYQVDESKLEAAIGNPMENAIWEEFGTGEYALNGDGRKVKWYIPIGNAEGQISQNVVDAYGMKVVHGKGGVDYVETSGKRAKRPFYTAYLAKKNAIQKRLESILKGLGK